MVHSPLHALVYVFAQQLHPVALLVRIWFLFRWLALPLYRVL